ncbi:protein tyrosine kinase domain-containing protein [Ditylenchus destructor]|uniref:Protein tyrosine kinase domain-containing protein n=1 Tax=Ditylenchus destructor TaxID=166010 RepID=A0AAD4R888_9BILA|nr:protein tyrosine kinase domain-containing protein [Ditylenchus destructor]
MRCTLWLEECRGAIGMESGRIEDWQLSASSSFDEQSTGPANARIRHEKGSGAWCPASQINGSSHEWIQVELATESLISAVETQGRWDRGRGMEYPTAYMIEYWRESLGRWARYKDSKGNEILQANVDTQSAVFHLFDGAILAKIVRLIPVSEVTRTVCLRFELYGCTSKESLLSYSLKDGSHVDDLDFRDTSYDGTIDLSLEGGSMLFGGLGKLTDGFIAADNFEENPKGWVGWHRRKNPEARVTINFIFGGYQNFSALLLHTNNFHKHGAALFRKVRISFGTVLHDKSVIFSPRVVQIVYPADWNFDTARWVRIPIPHRIGRRLKVELDIAEEADWLLISEVKFESDNVSFQFEDKNLNSNFETIFANHSNDKNSLPKDPFTVEDNEVQSSPANCLIIGLLISASLISLLLLAVLYCILVSKRTPMYKVKSNDVSHESAYSKATLQMILTSADKRPKLKVLPSTTAKFHTLKRLGDIQTFSACSDSSSNGEYAEPGENLSTPLLDGPCQSVHYATGNIVADSIHYFSRSPTALTGSMCSSSTSPSSRYRATPSASAFGWASGITDNGPKPYDIVNFDYSTLHYVKNLGNGKFGTMHLCRLDEHRMVAVEELDENVTSELGVEWFRSLGTLKHQNILHFIGASASKSQPQTLCCIHEFAVNGDLRQFLRNQSQIGSEVLVSFATQIAAGMAYLESRGVLHCDLATRNCLVGHDSTIKITNFGLTKSCRRQWYANDYCHVNEHSQMLPVRWMAWESLVHNRWTNKSDVWMFGMTLWEMFNKCSCIPFPQMIDSEVIEVLQMMSETRTFGATLSVPEHCPGKLYRELLLPCWRYEEDNRLNFLEIHRYLQKLPLMQSSSR